MQNFAVIRSAVLEKMTLEVAFFSSCKAVFLAELPFLHFCKRKTKGETQFWIELAAPCTFANHNEINSDDTLPFIIFFTPVYCDGSNRLWHERLCL